MIPAVQAALDAVAQQLEIVRLDFPNLPPRQQEMLAKSRCIAEITAANQALDHQSAGWRQMGSAGEAAAGRVILARPALAGRCKAP